MLHVLAVPNLSDVAALAAAQKLSTDGSAREHPDSSRVLFRLRPQASAPPVSKGCLGSCVEWLPSPPHDLLLVSSYSAHFAEVLCHSSRPTFPHTVNHEAWMELSKSFRPS